MRKLTREQIRAARGLLGVSQDSLASTIDMERAGLSKFESGKQREVHLATMEKIFNYFDSKGLHFTEFGGVEFKPKKEIERLSGQTGFRSFMDNVYEAAVDGHCIFRIQNAKPSNWIKHLGADWYEKHSNRMKEFADKISFKITCCEGDHNQIASSFAEYKWVKEKSFSEQSIYLYGDQVAFLNFAKNNVKIININSKEIAKTITETFDFFWEHNTITPFYDNPENMKD